MLTDAHCHIFDFFIFLKNASSIADKKDGLDRFFKNASSIENKKDDLDRSDLFKNASIAEMSEAEFAAAPCFKNVSALAVSAWRREEFEFYERFAAASAARIVRCFAVHPQLPTVKPHAVSAALETLHSLLAENRAQAVGETGFDLFHGADSPDFRASEAVQERLFEEHVEAARAHGLPLVLHVRRAMRNVFAHTKRLKQAPAVVFHSFSGTAEDAASLLRRGVNAYFSFGTPILLNHKTARSACAAVPLDRLLSETDAPYQPRRGAAFSHWGDLYAVVEEMRRLREDPLDFPSFANRLSANFSQIFKIF